MLALGVQLLGQLNLHQITSFNGLTVLVSPFFAKKSSADQQVIPQKLPNLHNFVIMLVSHAAREIRAFVSDMRRPKI
jgi:heat shock protein HspQ